MLISYNWLEKFVQLDKSPAEIADRITLSLAEVEKIGKKGGDYILELENKGITHRPDCFSHLGIARETAAYFKLPYNNPISKLASLDIKPETSSLLDLSIEIEAEDLCRRFCGIVITNIKVAPSPEWLRTALERLGQDSINNVVDITNYVMFELGQPLHAFDYDKVSDKKIIVRKAAKGEELTTLDEEKRELTEDMLIIADTEKPIGLAGIKGGLNTAIDNNTNTIILEAANFDPKNNRKTSKILGLRTDASTRFEKNIDITLPPKSLKHTINLLQEHTEAKIASGVVEVQNAQFEPKRIEVAVDWINKFIGFNLSGKKMINILHSLDINAELKDNTLTVIQPSWRQDIAMQADIAEEIARIHGYDKIPVTLPLAQSKPPRRNKTIESRQKVKRLLCGLGYNEVHTQPFTGPRLLKAMQMDGLNHLQLVNPLTVNQKFMRRLLLPSLLAASKGNLNHFDEFKLFEINRIFVPREEKTPQEISHLAGVSIGENFYRIKGDLEVLLEHLHIGAVNFQASQEDSEGKDILSRIFNKECSASIRFDEDRIGAIGYLKPEILLNLEFPPETELIIYELDFAKLIEFASNTPQYKPIPQYPPLIEDMTFKFPPQTHIGPVMDIIEKQSTLIRTVELSDIYKNSYTFRIYYQSLKKSLSTQDIDHIREKLSRRIEKEFDAKLKA